MTDPGLSTPPRERAAVLMLERAVDGGAAHGVRTSRAGRILAAVAWGVVLVAVLVLVLVFAWPRRSWLEFGFLAVVMLGAWCAGAARFFTLAGAQWPVLSRYIDADAVRRDAALLRQEPAASVPQAPLRRLWQWHAQADLMTRLKRVSIAAAAVLLAAVLIDLLVVPRAIAMFHPARGAAPGQVTVLTTKWCPYCGEMRMRLRGAHVPFTEVDVESGWRESLALQATGRRSIPTTLIGSELLPRGMTSQLNALHAACLQRHDTPAADCRMLDPGNVVRIRRVDGALSYELVPRPASIGDPDSRVGG